MTGEEVIDDQVEESEQPTTRGKRRRAWSFPKLGEPRAERAPLTEEEWTRVLRGRAITVVSLVTAEQREWAGNQARDCGTCKGVKLHGDPRHGFCVPQGIKVGISFPKLCRKHEYRE